MRVVRSMTYNHWYLGVMTHEHLSNISKMIVEANTILDKVSELVDEFMTNKPQKAPYTFYKAIETACYADTILKAFTEDFATFEKETKDVERYGQVNEWNVIRYLHVAQSLETKMDKIRLEAKKALDLIEAVFKYY